MLQRSRNIRPIVQYRPVTGHEASKSTALGVVAADNLEIAHLLIDMFDQQPHCITRDVGQSHATNKLVHGVAGEDTAVDADYHPALVMRINVLSRLIGPGKKILREAFEPPSCGQVLGN